MLLFQGTARCTAAVAAGAAAVWVAAAVSVVIVTELSGMQSKRPEERLGSSKGLPRTKRCLAATIATTTGADHTALAANSAAEHSIVVFVAVAARG